MADGGYCRALLYLLDHPIPAQLAEPLGGWKRPPWVIFGITNLLLIRGQQMLHTLSNRARVLPLIAQNVSQEGFNPFVHRHQLYQDLMRMFADRRYTAFWARPGIRVSAISSRVG